MNTQQSIVIMIVKIMMLINRRANSTDEHVEGGFIVTSSKLIDKF